MIEKKKGSLAHKLGGLAGSALMASIVVFVIGFAVHWYWFLLSVGWWLCGKCFGI